MTTLFIGPIGFIKKAVFNDFFKEQIAFSNIKIQYRENFQMIISKVIHKQRGSVIVV